MKALRNTLLIILLASMLAYGCKYQSYRDYRNAPYDGLFEWTEATRKAGWSNRLDHAALRFNDRLWVMGGYSTAMISSDPYMEDVWSSPDGAEWTLEVEAAPWLGRRGHAAVVFDDGNGEAMYVIGGFVVDEESGYREYRNDVWRSYDGLEWKQIKERSYPPLDSIYDWIPRFNHACVVAEHEEKAYIYLVGGTTMLEDHNIRYSMEYFNDVWRSSDGITWERLPNTDFGFRAEHALAVDPISQRLYLQGGRHGEIFDAEGNASHPHPEFHWLWHSDDGITWTSENDTALFEQDHLWRCEHQMVVMDQSLFGLPGRSASNHHTGFRGTYWRYNPGNLWSIDSEGSDFNNRYGYALVTDGDRVWILGGETADDGPDNDVWYGEIQ